MIDLEVGLPVIVNGHKAEIEEIGWRDEDGKYISVKVEYEDGKQVWVPVKKLERIKENTPTITPIRPRELYYQQKHAGRVFPAGSGGRIIEKSHPARGSDVIVLGAMAIEPIKAMPKTKYTVQVVEGPHSGEIYSILGDKEKLWLDEPLKPDFPETVEEVSIQEPYREIPEGLPLSEVPEEQLPLFDHEQYLEDLPPDKLKEAYNIAHPRAFSDQVQVHVELDLPPLYERILDAIFGEERDYNREFPTAKQLGTKLGLKTKTSKFYMDTIRKRMRDRGILLPTEFDNEEVEEKDLSEPDYLEFWGIEYEEKEKD